MTFAREVVVLLTKPSMFGKFYVQVLEVVWRFEPITFYIGSSRAKLILAPVTKHGRFCGQNNQIHAKSHDELKDNSNSIEVHSQVRCIELSHVYIHAWVYASSWGVSHACHLHLTSKVFPKTLPICGAKRELSHTNLPSSIQHKNMTIMYACGLSISNDFNHTNYVVTRVEISTTIGLYTNFKTFVLDEWEVCLYAIILSC